MMCLPLKFLVLRAMILYLPMILISPLSSLIDVPHKIYTYMTCMILLLPMILPLWLVLVEAKPSRGPPNLEKLSLCYL
jgi:hypothetical protein